VGTVIVIFPSLPPLQTEQIKVMFDLREDEKKGKKWRKEKRNHLFN